MATVAELMIKLGMDDSGLDKGMSSSGSKLQSWGNNLKSVGTKLTAGVTVPLVAAGVAALNWASDQQEAGNKVDVVFGDSAKGVHEWARSTEGSLLMSTAAAEESAGTFGNLFTSMGMGQQESADLSTDLVELGQDLSSFNNIPTDQALIALRAALVGEYEPMRALGVQLSQATVEQKALEMGIWDGNGAMTAQQRVLATNALIMEQTANAQGDAARTAKGFANQMRILRANLEDAGAELGEIMLPYIQELVAWLTELVDRFANLDPKWQKIILLAAGLAAAIGPLLLALGFLLPALGAIATVIGFLLSPIGLLVIAIAALIGLGIYAFINDLWGVRDAVYSVIDALSVFTPMLGDLMDVFQAAREGDWAEVFDELKDSFISLGVALFELQGIIFAALAGIGQSIIDWAQGYDWYGLLNTVGQALWEGMVAGFEYAWPIVSEWLAGLGTRISTALSDASDWAATMLNKGSELIMGLLDGITLAWPFITTWASGVGPAIIAAVEAAGSFLLLLVTKGGELLQGLLDGLAAKWPAVSAWLLLLPSVVLAAVPDMLRTLRQRGLDAISGMYDGILDQWAVLKGWLSGFPSYIFLAVPDLARILHSRGVDAIAGMYDGVLDKWAALKSWLGGMAGYVSEAVGDLSSALYDAGASIMDGLLSGINSGWDLVSARLSEISGLIPSWKGPPEKDAKLLIDNGKLIMQGLGVGLDHGWDGITSQLAGYTSSLDGVVGASMSGAAGGYGSAPVTNNYFSLKSQELIDLIRNAESGGEFANNFGQQMGLYAGTP